MRDWLLRAAAGLAVRHSGLVLLVAAALALAGGALAGLRLGLNSNQDALISTDLPHHARYMAFVEEFGDLEDLYVVIDQQPDRLAARRFALAVADELARDPRIENVHARLRAADLGDKLLLLVPDEQFGQVQAGLSAAADELGPLARADGFAALFEHLAARMERPALPVDGGAPAQDDEQGLDFLRAALDAVGRDGVLPPPLLQGLELPPDEGFQEAGRYLLVTFTPRRDYSQLDPVEAPLRSAREAVARLRQAYPQVDAGVTGRAALSSDEMRRTSWEMTWGALLGTLGVTLVFSLVFRELVRPLLAVLCLAIATGWTFGAATLLVGTLNLLSSVFAIVLVGIGIDFGIHVLAAYRAQLSRCDDPAQAALEAALRAGRANVISALTTMAAFFSTLLTDFLGLAELGFLAGIGVFLCLVSMQLCLPAALCLVDRRRGRGGPRVLPVPHALERVSAHPGRVLAGAALVSLVGLLGLPRVRFDLNLLALQAPDLESVVWEHRLLRGSDLSSWTTVALADSLQEAARLHRAFAALGPPVARVESAVSMSLAEPPGRRERLAQLAAAVGRLGVGPPAERVDLEALRAALGRLDRALSQLAEMALAHGVDPEGIDLLVGLSEQAATTRAGLPAAEVVAPRQAAYFRALRGELARLDALLAPSPWSVEDIPAPLRRHLVSARGRFAVHVFPSENVWDPAAMARFLEVVRAIDPQVTGATVSVHESSRVMVAAFRQVLWVTLLLVALLIAIEYRSLSALLGMGPLAVGTLWLVELMGALGISFNMANFFAVPVLIGVGMDNIIHLINHRRANRAGPIIGHEIGTSVILSSLTTMIGFGALGLASHAGLASFGHLMAAGALCLLGAAVLLLPAAIRLREARVS